MLAVTIRRMGNSLGIIIPQAYLKAMGLHENSKINLEQEDGTLVISPIAKQITLEDLVARMTPENTHPEISTRYAVGAENLVDEHEVVKKKE